MEVDSRANIGAFGKELEPKAGNTPNIKSEHVPQRT